MRQRIFLHLRRAYYEQALRDACCIARLSRFEQHVWALPVVGLSALLVFRQHRRGPSGTRSNKSADNPVRPAGPTSFMITSSAVKQRPILIGQHALICSIKVSIPLAGPPR